VDYEFEARGGLMKHLEDILAEAARIRGVPNLPNRVISDFGGFVRKLIFDDEINHRYGKYLEEEDEILGLGKAFLQYYRDMWGDEE